MGLRMHWGWVLILGCGCSVFTNLAMAEATAKQPPLEIPKALLEGDAAEPSRPDLVKKSGPKANDAPAKSDNPDQAAKPAVKASQSSKSDPTAAGKPKPAASKTPLRDLKGLPEMGVYATKPGESVDKILQTFYAGSPVRMDVLRDALVQNNSKAFPKGHAKSMVKGAVLSLPDPMALALRLMQPLPATTDPAPVAPTVTSVASMAAVTTPMPLATPAVPMGGGGAAAHSSGRMAGQNLPAQDPRRSWVRYP